MDLPPLLSAQQIEAVQLARRGGATCALIGPPGSGKTTALIARLRSMLAEGIRPHEILVLVPQRAQAERITMACASLDGPARGGADVVTYYGLARRALSLYWPLVAAKAGFDSSREPTFCTVEAAQYHMLRIVQPKIEQDGYFSELKIRRERLLSQLIDNLNKAAVVGYDHTDTFRRLRLAWTGAPEQANVYWQAQDCAIAFRQYCLDHNLVDFSLTIEAFRRHLLTDPVYSRYFAARYRHLLVDSIEENVPVAQDLIETTLPEFESALITLDEGAGHRVFLGADAVNGRRVAESCQRRIVVTDRYGSVPIRAFGERMSMRLGEPDAQARPSVAGPDQTEYHREQYWIGMCGWVVNRVDELRAAGTPANEIAILAPYVTEVMRFALQERLAERDIPLYVLRPSAPLYQDPVVRGLAGLACLAYADATERVPGLYVEDLALTLRIALDGLDPVRAQRLAEAVGSSAQDGLVLPDARLAPRDVSKLWNSVGYDVRERFATLCQWLDDWRTAEPQPLPVLWARLFADVLSRPGFGFHQNTERARSLGRLMESTNKFGQAVGQEADDPVQLAGDYLQLVLDGVATAEFQADRPLTERSDEVLLAPAYAYLTRDLRTDVQVWLDLGSDGWFNRPNQPLTNPYVLSRQWPEDRMWTDVDEERAKRDALNRVVRGLTARCGDRLILASSTLGLDGAEQSGRLERAIVRACTR